MSADVIDGKAVANQIMVDTAVRAEQFTQRTERRPCLATVLVGDDPASHTYVRMKTNRCRDVGLDSRAHHLPPAPRRRSRARARRTVNASSKEAVE